MGARGSGLGSIWEEQGLVKLFVSALPRPCEHASATKDAGGSSLDVGIALEFWGPFPGLP